MTTVEALVKEISKEEMLECEPIRDRFDEIFGEIDPLYNNLKDKDEEELQMMLAYEMGLMPTNFEVNPSETRQATQYNPNNYNCKMTFDCTTMYAALLARVAGAAKGKKLTAYIQGKAALFKVIENRYSAFERFQRGLMRKEQRREGITPIPNN
jgi:hypothetical protein